MLLVACLYAWTTCVPASPTAPSAASLQDASIPSRLCVIADVDGRLLARTCAAPAVAMRWAPNPARLAAGLPPCWWTLEATDLADVRGLGEARAAAIVAARDRGVPPTAQDLARDVRGVGANLAQRVVEAVAVDCGP